MTSEQLDALERLARAATPGKWEACEMTHYGQAGTGFWYVDPLLGESEAEFNEGDARYIAAANPETMLALIARVRELEAVLSVIASPGSFEDYGNGWAVEKARAALTPKGQDS